MVKRVVMDLVSHFSGLNHVLYLDNYFTSGPLVKELYEEQIYVVSSIQQRAEQFEGHQASKRELSATTFSMTVTWCLLLQMPYGRQSG